MLKGVGHIKLWKPIVIIVLLDQLLKLYIKTAFEVGESFAYYLSKDDILQRMRKTSTTFKG